MRDFRDDDQTKRLNSPMRLTLHIGSPQCGGAAIQSHLNDLGKTVSPLNPGEESGSLLLLGQTTQARDIYVSRFGEPDIDRVRHLKETLVNCGLEHVVLSNVFFSEITDQEFIGSLALELEEIFDQMQAVVYVQHQMRDFPKLMSQRVKSGMVNWADIQSIPFEHYKYDDLYKRWDQDIDLIVRDFGRCEHTIVEDFCSVSGLTIPPGPHKLAQKQRFDDVGLHLMVLINSCAHPGKERIRRRIAAELERMQLSDRLPELNQELVSILQGQFETGNAWVSEQFLDGVPLLY